MFIFFGELLLSFVDLEIIPALEAQLMARENALKELTEQSQTKITQYEQANPEAEYENHNSLLQDMLSNQATLTTYQNSSKYHLKANPSRRKATNV